MIRAATYDKEAKALYVYFEPKGSKKVAHTMPSPDGSAVYWDLDKEFNVLGVEILNVDLEEISNDGNRPKRTPGRVEESKRVAGMRRHHRRPTIHQ